MDDAQKKAQDDLNVQHSSGVTKEAEKPFVATETTPAVELDSEVKEAGVEVVDSPDLVPHEIIKANVQIPQPVVQQPVVPVTPAKTIASVKLLKRKKIYTDSREANAWKEEVEIREDLKKAN